MQSDHHIRFSERQNRQSGNEKKTSCIKTYVLTGSSVLRVNAAQSLILKSYLVPCFNQARSTLFILALRMIFAIIYPFARPFSSVG